MNIEIYLLKKNPHTVTTVIYIGFFKEGHNFCGL